MEKKSVKKRSAWLPPVSKSFHERLVCRNPAPAEPKRLKTEDPPMKLVTQLAMRKAMHNRKVYDPLHGFKGCQEHRLGQFPQVDQGEMFPVIDTGGKKRGVSRGPMYVEDTIHKDGVIEGLELYKLLESLESNPKENFIYLQHALAPWDVKHHPYTLKIMPYHTLDKDHYLTFSKNGVSHFWNQEADFTPLREWMDGCKLFYKLQKINTIGQFRKWKAVRLWRQSVRRSKFLKSRKYIAENLFILTAPLQKALLTMQEIFLKMAKTPLIDVTDPNMITLDEFVDRQKEYVEKMREYLEEVRNLLVDITGEALLTAFDDKGYVLDDSAAYEKLIARYQSMAIAWELNPDLPFHMTYAAQAAKRSYCTRMARFIMLVDYKYNCAMHRMIRNSIRVTLFHMHDKLHTAPEEYLDCEEVAAVDEMVEPIRNLYIAYEGEFESTEANSLCGLWATTIVVQEGPISIEPSLSDFEDKLNDVFDSWVNLINSSSHICTDSEFDLYANPIINGSAEDGEPFEAPEMGEVMDEDEEMKDWADAAFHVMQTAYALACVYVDKFEPLRIFWDHNESVEKALLPEIADVPVYRKYLLMFNKQSHTISQISDKFALGIIILSNTKFKSDIIPSPESCIEILHEVCPALTRMTLDKLIEEAKEAQNWLAMEPVTSEEYVDFLGFLEEIPEKAENMEGVAEYLRDLYDVMEEFDVPVPPSDHALYATLGPMLSEVQRGIDGALTDRDTTLQLFVVQLQKDVAILQSDVDNVKKETMNVSLLEPKTGVDVALGLLNDLDVKLQDCQERTTRYQAYQRRFKIMKMKFEELDDISSALKLRLLLWDSLVNFDELLTNVYEADFSQLDTESLGTSINKYNKVVQQLEKGLPYNDVLPILKGKVEDMKIKLPTIVNLRNPSMKARHWGTVDVIIGTPLQTEEPMTLTYLTQAEVFTHADELQEVSAQASAEYSLEMLLKKVSDAWKDVEFTTVCHKDQKDVFILGGTEEIQMLLDESVININTILSSRHVGPIKSKVDEWATQLDLFSKTLEEWMNCQRNWLYLESIFIAPDIQRQLPAEAKMFNTVDKSWKDIMRRTQKLPHAFHTCTQSGLLETFQTGNGMLDQIMKCLEEYLESKRVIFPRFYFLSNDELLEILAQTRNPLAVQPHLRKCFDAILRLDFSTKAAGGGVPGTKVTNDILAMVSPEGERVTLTKGLKARGNVEDWLGRVEEAMFVSLKQQMKASITDFKQRKREVWMLRHPAQIVLAVSQMMWCREVQVVLDGPYEEGENLRNFEVKCFDDLNKLAALVRGELPNLHRATLCAVITVDVHARDIITGMVSMGISSSSQFEWLKQLRYYWDEEVDTCIAKMANSEYKYGYEYLGASPRLVITPLTDRCYLCLMGALQLDLGGAPAGPAGTGKTETTKDLAKSLAFQCIVFNCSDTLDYKMMGRFFSGLAQSGAWCCFDEFNRIDIEVLSVIAQQLITIRNAKLQKLVNFVFEGREIKLNRTCAAYITMNPGYAGRTELPDNLKALFRPISMMVPDYALIAEVILYSEGFESSKPLAKKMVQMYKLCSEQLSQQDHYDFGMRAVKSVLVMAGSLKRENPDKSEDVVLIRALRDSNLPKFLAQDANLFQGILRDLFPGVTIPEQDYGRLQEAIERVIRERSFQVHQSQVKKVIQLYETMIVRHGVMLVGPTGGGKTTVYRALKDALTLLHAEGVQDQYYKPVEVYVVNPKAVSMGELYGEVNPLTLEWRDGLLGYMVRLAVGPEKTFHQWVICDGPVDAVWIENMNTVLDDNKMLCLANSERIKLTNWVHMVFEVQDLAQASPATVSRCGMVYIDPSELGWEPYVTTFLLSLPEDIITVEMRDYLMVLFHKYLQPGLTFVGKRCDQTMAQVNFAKISMLCSLIKALLAGNDPVDFNVEKSRLNQILCQTFAFCYAWSIGGNLMDTSFAKLEEFIRSQFEEDKDAKLTTTGDLWSFYNNYDLKKSEMWEKLIPIFKYDRELPYFDVLVPTKDTVRFGRLMELLLSVNRSVLFTGTTGVGKSAIAREVLMRISDKANYIPVFINFSAQTNSKRTQEMLESKMEKRRKNHLTPPPGKQVIIFIDDLNMPKLDTYGSQPPIELLRQLQDFGGFYDRESIFWKDITGLTLCAACAPPGGGRNPVTARLLRHFCMLSIPSPSTGALKHIFKAILTGFLDPFEEEVKTSVESVVNSAIEMYQFMAMGFLPTPAKSHYVFNLRDLSKCIQGVLQADSEMLVTKGQLQKLFSHECQRVFGDRLVNHEDSNLFMKTMCEVVGKHFASRMDYEALIVHPILFGDFMKMGVDREARIYDEIEDLDRLKSVLQDYLDEYNMSTSKETHLVFFMDAMVHLTRVARILRAERGNALLVGVGGTGKQSLTKLASYISGFKCFQIELCRGYDYNSFHDDLRRLFDIAGVKNQPTSFLFVDTQIVQEEFLEDVNNILNSGEVPNLYEPEDYEKVIIGVRSAAKQIGIPEGDRDGIYDFFVRRVRTNLHIVLCMSPVGDAFRNRCRMFPSLVNCCTIDWFTEWPTEALLSVAETMLEGVDLGSVNAEILARACVVVHESVIEMSDRFYNELRRHFYTTPSTYLELIQLYKAMMDESRVKIMSQKSKVKNGLMKLLETNVLVAKMKIELTALEPELKERSEYVNVLMVKLGKDQEVADAERQKVREDEAVAKLKAMETQAIADDAQRDLDEALPALDAAVKALNSLDKQDIAEIRVFNQPPPMVQTVMEAVCMVLGQKTDWASARQLLGDPNFMRRLYDYDKDNIPAAMLKKIKKYTDNPKFVPDEVQKVSKACKSMCMWVTAMELYAKAFQTVEPKRLKLAGAEEGLMKVMAMLKEKQERLAKIEAEIAALEKMFDDSVKERQDLENNMKRTSDRLARAAKLTTALADEQVRWAASIELYDAQIGEIPGNAFVAAACVAYYGAFSSNYRQELVKTWLESCKDIGIPVSGDLTLAGFLADPFEIRQWNSFGLPRDAVSTDNAILVKRGRRWPLMIDPQDQANRWIRQMEAESGLKVIKMTDQGFLRTVENSIRLGFPVLMEEVGETLEPSLEPVLLRQTYVNGGRLMIKLGDNEVDYDANFRFYMTTKMANPHYLPEVCIKVTIINFTVTRTGLEDQLLSDVVRLERPDLEKLRNKLIVQINTDKNQLTAIEDKILRLLFASEGNILDDEELIETLNDSKVTSAAITKRLAEAETTERDITDAREGYRDVAARGSVLYFVVAVLSEIDPMYQYSLKYFNQLFCQCIQTSKKSPNLRERLSILLSQTTLATYTNVARGLFEKDKLAFSFMLCIEIMKQDRAVLDNEWNLFLRGVPLEGEEQKSPVPWVNDAVFNVVVALEQTNHHFAGLTEAVAKKEVLVTIGDVSIDLCFDSEAKANGKKPVYQKQKTTTSPSKKAVEQKPDPDAKDVNDRLTSFHKLMLVKIMKEEWLIFSITEFVKTNLGEAFVVSPSIDLHTVCKELNKSTPLIFVLSAGSDPMGAFQRYAEDVNFAHRLGSISLGQGQGPVAERMILEAYQRGDWIFLQNCHLASSWMLRLEQMVKQLEEGEGEKNTKSFRLFLSSMPSSRFPVSVLQNSVKVTNEPPRGLRANIRRALVDVKKDFYEDPTRGPDWTRVLFGICFFHAVILERKKFGPLGWNIKYEFSDSDRECAFLNLGMFCGGGEEENDMGEMVAKPLGDIPWDALEYITGSITYGGRITDNWDQRTLTTILRIFFSPPTLATGYTYSPSGLYYAPHDAITVQQVLDYVAALPIIDDPEIFGMHDNANIAFQIQENVAILGTLVSVQPRTSVGEGGKTSDEVVGDMAEAMEARVPRLISLDEAVPGMFDQDSEGRMNSLAVFISQEVDRFNRLLRVLHSGLSNLQKAIKGLVVMSEELEMTYNALFLNRIPQSWSKAAYPSLKTLASWMKDMVLRVDFVRRWITYGLPKSYWISGLYFPQGFLTAALQLCARQYSYPIDRLGFKFIMRPLFRDQEEVNRVALLAEEEEKETLEEDEPGLEAPGDGVLIHGLFLEAARWDMEKMKLGDSLPGEMNPPLPVMHLEPQMDWVGGVSETEMTYKCPLYKTSARAGVLSTTGHSTNFVIAVQLPSDREEDYWILKGTALFTQLTD